MKVGDRVKKITHHRSGLNRLEPAIIIEISEEWNTLRYLIKYHDKYTINGTKVQTWVDEDDIMIDIEYYRDKKINEILK